MFSGLSEKLSFNPRFLLKMKKICFLAEKMVLSEVSYVDNDFKKHQTLEILTNLIDFYAFFKISHFSRFLKFIRSSY